MTKQEKIDNCRRWLINNDVEFLEHNHGHFKVFSWGNPLLEFWATTEKFTVIGSGTYQVGWSLIQKKIVQIKQLPPHNE